MTFKHTRQTYTGMGQAGPKISASITKSTQVHKGISRKNLVFLFIGCLLGPVLNIYWAAMENMPLACIGPWVVCIAFY